MRPKNRAEKTLFAAALSGESALIRTDLQVPSKGKWADWQEEHEIRANYLRHLLICSDLYSIDPKGIDIHGARLTGRLDIENLHIGHQLTFSFCQFDETPGLRDARTPCLNLYACRLPGFEADRLHVDGGLFLRYCEVRGILCLLGMVATGDVDLEGVSIHNPSDKSYMETAALTGNRMQVMGRLFLTKMPHRPRGHVTLRYAQIGELRDDGTAWPVEGVLDLHGLVYEGLGLPTTYMDRCRWLSLMPKLWHEMDENGEDHSYPVFFPQPYEQLIKAFRSSGHEHDARKMAIEKQNAYRSYLSSKARQIQQCGRHKGAYIDGEGRFLRRFWLWFIGVTISYGYTPWRAPAILFIAFVFGAYFFSYIHQIGLMEPSQELIYTHHCYTNNSSCPHWKLISHIGLDDKPRYAPADYPEFNALVYSMDVLLPVIDMKLESHWMPSSRATLGRAFFWFHIAMGWIFTTITVVGFTGLIKKD